jgi:hypothetical protein
MVTLTKFFFFVYRIDDARAAVDARNVTHLGLALTLGFAENPGYMSRPHGGPQFLRRPGADAEKIGHIGRINGIQELPLQGGQGLGLLANQQCIGQVQQMLSLRLREAEIQGGEEVLQFRSDVCTI